MTTTNQIVHLFLRYFILLLTGGFFLFSNQLQAQTLIVGSLEEDSVRLDQLKSTNQYLVSMAVRPIELQPAVLSWKKLQLSTLPLNFISQYNSHHPFGWNDGAMILAKGFQTFVRAGVYLRYGILEAQFAPEWVHAANDRYDTSINWGSNPVGVYNKVFPGQSAVGIRIGTVSIGASTQNLWWGPGIRSSLLMSNNAPGFFHFYIRSNRPAKTPIGSFEWQLIGSRLEGDSTRPYENRHLQLTTETYPAIWRYQSAFVISYQPKWIPGLFIGMTRSLQRYQKDLGLGGSSFFRKYIPVLTKAFQKKNEQNDDAEGTDQLASFFIRWVMPKSGWEFYGEWGYNDYKQNVRDYLMDATHSAAYIVGFQKLFINSNYTLQSGIEITKTAESPSNILRGAGNWYVHSGDNGYTHQNQIIGAGVGYGADLFSLRLNYIPVKSNFSLRMQLEQINRDPNSYPTKWIDYNFQIEPIWKIKQIKVMVSLSMVNSNSFLWQKDINVVNFFGKLNLNYIL